MERQHSSPILVRVDKSSVTLKQLPLQNSELESEIQELVHAHADALPIDEIDPMFSGAIAICRELQLGRVGSVDNFLITRSGLPVLVECKLWRNPEARRKVVGQILDYAKTLSRWSFSDLQREVSRRCGNDPDALLRIVRSGDEAFDEIQFVDAVSANLRRGRFLLLILGDGIRQDVEEIAEYLQLHAGLHFTFGLVEFPIFMLPTGDKIVAPRVVARTTSIVRTVVEVPQGYAVQEPAEAATNEESAEREPFGDGNYAFWKEFIDNHVRLDDRSQPIPNPSRQGYLSFQLPAPQGSSWLTVYREWKKGVVGVFLSASRNSPGETAMNAVVADWEEVQPELKGTAHLTSDNYGRPRIVDRKTFGSLDDDETRYAAFDWLAERVNTFVNVLRPRIREAVADDTSQVN